MEMYDSNHTVKTQITHYMHRHISDHVDDITCEVNLTSLAESCAFDLGHDEWLDDDTHIVWDIAFELAEQYEKSH